MTDGERSLRDEVMEQRIERLQDLVIATNQLAQSNNQTLREVVMPMLDTIRSNTSAITEARGALGMLRIVGIVAMALLTLAVSILGIAVMN